LLGASACCIRIQAIALSARSRSRINTVAPDADALEALMQMQRTGNSRLLVVDRGRLSGVLSLMLQFLSLKLEFGDVEV
jgi:predicted transcriptional regulator